MVIGRTSQVLKEFVMLLRLRPGLERAESRIKIITLLLVRIIIDVVQCVVVGIVVSSNAVCAVVTFLFISSSCGGDDRGSGMTLVNN